MPAWYQDGVVGACGWRASDGDRDAEHAYAADRCAHEIVGFLKVVGGALAAADRHTVGRVQCRALLDVCNDRATNDVSARLRDPMRTSPAARGRSVGMRLVGCRRLEGRLGCIQNHHSNGKAGTRINRAVANRAAHQNGRCARSG